MKVTNFDKLVPMHLGPLFSAVNDRKDNVKEIHADILTASEESAEALAESLSGFLKEYPAGDPAESSYSHAGFAPFPVSDEEDADLDAKYAVAIPGTNAVLAYVEKRERVLPGCSVRAETEKRMKALVEKEIDGWVPNKKDWAEMKDDVLADMLKTAPIRPSRTPVIIASPYAFFFTSSRKTEELCSVMLRKALGSFPVNSVFCDADGGAAFYLTRRVSEALLPVVPADYVHLKGPEEGGDAKIKGVELVHDQYTKDLIDAGYYVQAAAFSIKLGNGDFSIFAKISATGVMSSIYLDDEASSEVGHFENDEDGNAILFHSLYILIRYLGMLFDPEGPIGPMMREFSEEETRIIENDDEV